LRSPSGCRTRSPVRRVASRAQQNAYHQDGEISWHDWKRLDSGLIEFVHHLIRLADLPPHRFLLGATMTDIAWSWPTGGWRGTWREMIRTEIGMLHQGPIRRRAITVRPARQELVVLELLEGGGG
jgi:pullulanase/glycogen debranching enzyme